MPGITRDSSSMSESTTSLLEVALSFLASQPVVSSVIAGATRAEQVQANGRAGIWLTNRSSLRATGNRFTGNRSGIEVRPLVDWSKH